MSIPPSRNKTFHPTWLRPLLWSIILLPLLNTIYLISLNWQSIPSPASLGANVSQLAQYEISLLATVLFAVLHGRFPSVSESLVQSREERFISVLLVWLLGSLVLVAFWFLLRRIVNKTLYCFAIVAALMLAFLIWAFTPAIAVAIPTASTAHIQVNVGETLGPVPTHQRGFSQGGEIEMQQQGYFADIATKLVPLHPALIRIDHIYDYYNVYSLDATDQPVYDWSSLDKVIDAIYSTGAKPLISLGYLPVALAKETVYAPPADFQKWEELVYQTVHHFNVDRKLAIEYWEVWNEPNTSSFWIGSIDEYIELYAASVRGALRADPSIKIGGPATLSLPPEIWIGLPFYEQNFVSRLLDYTKQHNLKFDFLSWHYYDARPDKFIWSINVHQKWLVDAGVKAELLITEWNRTGGLHPSMETEQGSAYAVAVVSTLADTSLQSALFFEPFDSSRQWEGRWGLIRADKVLKPTYYAFDLIAKVRGDRIASRSDHWQSGAFTSRDGDTVYVLLWSIKPAPLQVELSVTGLPQNATRNITVSGVDAEHANAYRGPSAESLQISTDQIQTTNNGDWKTTLNLPANSIRLIEINP